jgi:hypothetical protein
VFKNGTAVNKVHAHDIAKNFKVIKTANGLTVRQPHALRSQQGTGTTRPRRQRRRRRDVSELERHGPRQALSDFERACRSRCRPRGGA